MLAETDGPQAGLDLLDELAPDLSRFQPAWATRAHLLERLGRYGPAVEAYEKAIALSTQPAERAYLESRREALPDPRRN